MPNLPSETVDCIIDLLHNEPKTLKACCLVSKSWIPRTRKYLFANIVFHSIADLERWKKRFPDPSNSPALYTPTLTICCPMAVLTALLQSAPRKVGSWVEEERWPCVLWVLRNLLTSCYNFSPVLRSLRVEYLILPCPEFFDLICSFPLLEDLAISGQDKSLDGVDDLYESRNVYPSTSPPLTGTLAFTITGPRGMRNTTRRLLELPNGLHFRELTVS